MIKIQIAAFVLGFCYLFQGSEHAAAISFGLCFALVFVFVTKGMKAQ